MDQKTIIGELMREPPICSHDLSYHLRKFENIFVVEMPGEVCGVTSHILMVGSERALKELPPCDAKIKGSMLRGWLQSDARQSLHRNCFLYCAGAAVAFVLVGKITVNPERDVPNA